MKRVNLIILLLISFFSPALSESNSKISIFNSTEKQNIKIIDKDKIIKDWFYFQPISNHGKMFSPVFIPFKYTIVKGEKDTKQSLTFPSLLSFKFDFVPDNYSTRHPPFIFQRDPEVVKLNENEKEKIVQYMKNWKGNFAIGGNITQYDDKYSGSIIVWDNEGNKVFDKDFKSPLGYFELMGQMVIEWMNFRKQNISEGLKNELIRPMTTEASAIEEFGEIFSVPSRSEKEWAIYEKILSIDPDFAEVRFWYGNQKHWNTRNRSEGELSRGKALKSHLVLRALAEFDSAVCPDVTLVKVFNDSFSYAKEISPNHPALLGKDIRMYPEKYSAIDLNAFIPIVKNYPDYNYLTNTVAYEFSEKNHYDKSIPLYLTSMQSGFLTPNGTFDYEMTQIGYYFQELGFLPEGFYFLDAAYRINSKGEKHWLQYHLAQCFRDFFYFSEAAALFYQKYRSDNNSFALLQAFMSLYEGGYKEKIEELKKSVSYADIKKEKKDLIDARENIALGKFEEASKILDKYKTSNKDLLLEKEIIFADMYLLKEDQTKAYYHARKAWNLSPSKRRTAYLLEKCISDSSFFSGFSKSQSTESYYSKDWLHFLEVTYFLYPDQEFWKRQNEQAQNKIQNENNSQIISEYESIWKQKNEKSKKESAFWEKYPPMYIEYITMKLSGMEDEKNRINAIKLYLEYSKSTRHISNNREAFERMYFNKLLTKTGVNDRENWLKYFDYEVTNLSQLMHLIKEHSEDEAIEFIYRGANIHDFDDIYRTPLMHAIRCKKPGVANVLIDRNADINATDHNDWTPLMFSILHKQEALSRRLISEGADINAKNDSEWTPLFFSLAYKQPELANLLIEKGAAINSLDKRKLTPLWFAVINNYPEIVRIITDKGGTLDSPVEDSTPLTYAIESGQIENAKILIEAGADINFKDKKNCVPLVLAIKHKQTEIEKLLIEKGCQIDPRDGNGWTPLMHALNKKETDTALLLIKKGADINAKNNKGSNVLYYAQKNRLTEIEAILKEKGAK